MSLNQAAVPVSSSSGGGGAEVEWGADESSSARQSASRSDKKALRQRQDQEEKRAKADKKKQAKEEKEARQAQEAREKAEKKAAKKVATVAEAKSETIASDVQPVTAAEQQQLDQPAPQSPFTRGVSVEDDAAAAAAASVEDSPVQVLPVPEAVASNHLLDITTPQASAPQTVPTPETSAPQTAPAQTRAAPTRAAYSSEVPLSKSPGFIAFRSNVQKRSQVIGNKVWSYFDLGPRDASVAPLVLIPGTSGTAEIFFQQLMSLGNAGYRVISCSPPAYFSADEWCNGFNGFLHALGLTGETKLAPTTAAVPVPGSAAAATPSSSSSPPSNAGKVHVFANSLAGYLALYYISHIIPSKNFIASLVLCNSFNSTTFFQEHNGGGSGWCIALLKRAPSFIVKKYVLDSLPTETQYPEAVDFMVDQLEDNLETSTLASRLILNIQKNRGVASPNSWKTKEGTRFPQESITILDTTDESVLPEVLRNQLYDALPNARYALLKSGGDFPFLSVADEVTMHLKLHLRAFGVSPSLNVSPAPAAARAPSPAEEDLPPAVHLSSLSGSPPSASPSTTVASSFTNSSNFLAPSASHASFQKANRVALGYGHDEEELVDNDSIFLSKHAAAQAARAAQDTSARSSPTQDSLPPAERAEALGSAAFQAARASERRVREEQAAAEAAQLAEDNAKDERQKVALSALLDDGADDEQRLTQKRVVVKQSNEDLF